MSARGRKIHVEDRYMLAGVISRVTRYNIEGTAVIVQTSESVIYGSDVVVTHFLASAVPSVLS